MVAHPARRPEQRRAGTPLQIGLMAAPSLSFVYCHLCETEHQLSTM